MPKLPNPESKRMGAYIHSLMRVKGITQTELAKRIGSEQSYISQLTRGDIGLPGPDKLHLLADTLDTTEEEFLRRAGYIRTRKGGPPSLRPGLQAFTAKVEVLAPEVQDKVAVAAMAIVDAVGVAGNNAVQAGDIRMRDVPEAARPFYDALREMIERLPEGGSGEATA